MLYHVHFSRYSNTVYYATLELSCNRAPWVVRSEWMVPGLINREA